MHRYENTYFKVVGQKGKVYKRGKRSRSGWTRTRQAEVTVQTLGRLESGSARSKGPRRI